MLGEEARLDAIEIRARRPLREPLADGVHPRERAAADQGLVQRHGEAVRVDRLRELHRRRLPREHAHDGAEVLGRGVAEGARHGQERRLVRRDAEIEHEGVDGVVHVREEDIVRLDVLVPEAGGVQRGEPARDRDEDVVRLAERHRARGDPLAEALALVERHREPHVRDRPRVAGNQAVIGELDDVRVRDAREPPQLLLRVARRVLLAAHDLERDLVLGHLHVARLPDLPVGALAQPREQPVAPCDDGADLEASAAHLELHGPAGPERTCHARGS